SACQTKGARVGALADVLLAQNDSNSGIVEVLEVFRRAVCRRVVPDDDLARCRRSALQDVSNAFLEEVQAVVRQDDDRDLVGRGVGGPVRGQTGGGVHASILETARASSHNRTARIVLPEGLAERLDDVWLSGCGAGAAPGIRSLTWERTGAGNDAR